MGHQGHRHLQGLQWAFAREMGPWDGKIRRPRGAKAAGLRYEKSVGEALGPTWTRGSWYEFRDARGRGWAQPDFWGYLSPHEGIPCRLVLECKYTWTLEAHTQLQDLYLPLITRAHHCRALGAVVCKVLTPVTPRQHVVGTLHAAEILARRGVLPIIHWPRPELAELLAAA